jgi:hypothetical protein
MRELLHETADLAADYLESVPNRPVFPRIEPDELRDRLGGALPEGPTAPRDVVRDLAAGAPRVRSASPAGAISDS